MHIETDEEGQIASVAGTATLLSDDTYWWDIIQWTGCYAQVDGYIDGVRTIGIISFIFTRAPNYINDLRDHTPKPISWRPSQLAPGDHTISYCIRDVYSGAPYVSGGNHREVGNIIVEYSIYVHVDDEGRQYLRYSERRNLGYGPMQCGNMKGEPVNVGTGNSVQQQTDISIAGPGDGLSLARTYNSHSDSLGPFGFGWTHNYNLRLNQIDDLHIELEQADGRTGLFTKNPDDVYQETTGRPTYIEALLVDDILQGWRWHKLDGAVYDLDVSGRLKEITKSGNAVSLSYDAFGRLERIDNQASGRSLQLSYNAQGLISTVSGPITPAIPTGIWVNYLYDANQNLVSVTYADGSGFNYSYTDPNDIHNLTGKQDMMNHLLATWGYDDQDRVVDNWSRDGRGIQIEYTGYSTRTVTDAYGSTYDYTFSVLNGYMTFSQKTGSAACRECGGNVVKKEYDGNLRVTGIEYADGLKYQFDDFDARGNAETVKIGLGTPEEKTVTRTFHPQIRALLTQTEPSVLGAGDKVTIWDYDDDGNATPNENPTLLIHRKIEQGFTRDISGSVIPCEAITTYTYNSKGQILAIDGPRPGSEDTTTFIYDETTGDLLSVTRPVVGTTTYAEYSADGKVGRTTDPNGNAVLYTYDGKGRLLTVTQQGVGTAAYVYNAAGDLVSVTRPNGVTANLIYDATYGRLTRVVDALGDYTAFSYDGQGNRIEIARYNAADQLVFRKRFDYQTPGNPGKLWKEINPDDTFTEYAYDSSGNVHTVTDAAGRATAYSYDTINRLHMVTQPGDVVTLYAYDTQDNLASVTDAENHATTYVHDDLGRLVAATSPDTGATSYAYDAAGNLIAKKDAKGNTIQYTYDDLNRLAAIRFPDSTQDVTYAYDEGANGKGRLTSMVDASGTYTYAFNVLGLINTEGITLDGAAFTTSYTYDQAGLPASITYPSGRVIAYQRDGAGNLAAITATKDAETQTLAENISHLPFGPVSGMAYGNGITLSQSYDQLYRLSELRTGSIQDLTYDRDPVGNIVSITDHLDAAMSRSFSYDDLYRLTGATGIQDTISYAYDKVGNRLNRSVNGASEQYSYIDGTNRIQGVNGTTPITYEYDANGNITARGAEDLTYTQNNRLIRVTENTSVLGEYVYNGRGERVKKVTDRGTVYYLYDKDGNLIAEADQQGSVTREYIYAEGRRLAMIQEENSDEIRVTVTTSKGRNLSGIKVYAFTESGSYTGKCAETDDQGTALFSAEAFPDGFYKFRADYLASHFWSPVIGVPGTSSAQVTIDEEAAETTVTVAGAPQSGVKVYLFNENGSYLGLYAVTDEQGNAFFVLPVGNVFKFRADYLSNQYWSEAITVESEGTTYQSIAAGGGMLSVTTQKEPGAVLQGLKVYLFSSSGSYLGQSATSDENGRVSFVVPAGSFTCRADYLGYHFWTDVIGVSTDTDYTVTIPHQDVTITVNGDLDSDIVPLEGLNVYLFTPTGAYLGVSRKTDQLGKVSFNLPGREYKARADCLSEPYWSEAFTWEDATVTVPEGRAEVTVTNMGLPLEGVRAYVFNPEGAYLGLNGETDAGGMIAFRLPQGEYNFRADYLGSQYWSGTNTLIPNVSNPVGLSTGGGTFALTLLGNEALPLENVPCCLFSESGAYLGKQGVTSSQGEVDFNLADGAYKLRSDYLGYHFWTEPFTVPAEASLTETIPHQDVTITVNGDYNGDVLPFPNLRLYLFTPSGAYQNRFLTTDDRGAATFSLPERDYKVRADYLNVHYWSDIFNGQDTGINISEGIAEVHATQGSNLLPNVNLYVFSSSDAYLGINGKTDDQGSASFRLPEGTYKFRADYQGNHFWAAGPIQADRVNEIDLNTGGGSVVLTVQKAEGMPLANIPVYVFTSNEAYLGMSGATDDQGFVAFDLSDGSYKFRTDYLGYHFWTEPFEVPQALSQVLSIPHQDVAISVNKTYGSSTEPLEGVRTYLFTENGSYQNIHADTDDQGQVVFNLPLKSFKVRADYLNSRYWSDAFEWENREINIEHGEVRLHVTENGTDLEDVPVYLFTDQGAYLGQSTRTDQYGYAVFNIPAKSYKFRVDHDGSQYWSDVVNVLANEETEVSMALDQLALNLTNNPNPARFDGKPPAFRPAEIRVAAIGSLTGLLLHAVVAQTSEERIYYFVNDHLGTPQKIMDENGQVVWSAAYLPFGEVSVQAATITNNLRFPGQYHDAETALHYNYHRYYDPQTGRYLTPDPIGQAGGINLFIYVQNNPVNDYDLLGLYSFREGLQDTEKYAGVSATISFLTPGGQVAAIVFTGIGIAAIGLEIALYPDNIYIDSAKAIIKQILQIRKPFNMFTDQAIDYIADAIKRSNKRGNPISEPNSVQDNQTGANPCESK